MRTGASPGSSPASRRGGRNWDGLLPVPGDGRYEWDGFHEADDLPRAIDPPRGFVATANEMNLPEGYPAEARRLGFEWLEPWRAERIHAVLDRQDRHGLADSMALQTDDLSLPARRLAGHAAALPAEPGIAAARALLAGFDGRLHAASGAALLAEIWWIHHLRPALLAHRVPDAATRALLAPGDAETLLPLLDAEIPDVRDALLARTLAARVPGLRRALRPPTTRPGPGAGSTTAISCIRSRA